MTVGDSIDRAARLIILHNYDIRFAFLILLEEIGPRQLQERNAVMEPAGPERRNHKLLGRSSHCQRKVLPSRPMTRKQWKHKTNKALKDLFPTVLSRGTIRQNQMNIKPGLIEMRSTGYLLCTVHSPHGCAACRVLENLHRQCLIFLTAQYAKEFPNILNLGLICLQKPPTLGARSVCSLFASHHPGEWMSWT